MGAWFIPAPHQKEFLLSLVRKKKIKRTRKCKSYILCVWLMCYGKRVIGTQGPGSALLGL